MNSDFIKNQKGLIALITVLIVLAVTLVIGIGLGLRSVTEMKIGLQRSQSSQAYYLANLCSEHALMKLKENPGYTGNEIINIEGGECQILPIEGNWIIKVSAIFSNQIKKAKIVVNQINPQMVIASWQEVAEF